MCQIYFRKDTSHDYFLSSSMNDIPRLKNSTVTVEETNTDVPSYKFPSPPITLCVDDTLCLDETCPMKSTNPNPTASTSLVALPTTALPLMNQMPSLLRDVENCYIIPKSSWLNSSFDLNGHTALKRSFEDGYQNNAKVTKAKAHARKYRKIAANPNTTVGNHNLVTNNTIASSKSKSVAPISTPHHNNQTNKSAVVPEKNSLNNTKLDEAAACDGKPLRHELNKQYCSTYRKKTKKKHEGLKAKVSELETKRKMLSEKVEHLTSQKQLILELLFKYKEQEHWQSAAVTLKKDHNDQVQQHTHQTNSALYSPSLSTNPSPTPKTSNIDMISNVAPGKSSSGNVTSNNSSICFDKNCGVDSGVIDYCYDEDCILENIAYNLKECCAKNSKNHYRGKRHHQQSIQNYNIQPSICHLDNCFDVSNICTDSSCFGPSAPNTNKTQIVTAGGIPCLDFSCL